MKKSELILTLSIIGAVVLGIIVGEFFIFRPVSDNFPLPAETVAATVAETGAAEQAAAYEAFQRSKAVGLPDGVFEEAGAANGQITPLMKTYLETHKIPEEARGGEAVQKLMRGHMNIAEKDLAWALQLARKAGVSLPVGGLVSQLMARLYGVEDEGRR